MRSNPLSTRPNMKGVVLLFVWLCLPLRAAPAGPIIYVDAHATGPVFDGSSWCSAYRQLYEALAVATTGATIRVADGTYKPDPTGLADPRSATMTLIGGITLEGGYAGCGAPDPDDRDIEMHRSILSCDLLGDDQPGFLNRADNCLTILSIDFSATASDVGGFTVTGASRNAFSTSFVSVLIHQCDFVENGNVTGGSQFSTAYYGGAISQSSGNVRVDQCKFRRNRSRSGAVFNYSGNTELVDSQFLENVAPNGVGGAFHSDNASGGGDLHILRCTFLRNSSSSGGAIAILHRDSGALHCEHSKFDENSAPEGGAISLLRAPSVLENCLFRANSAVQNGAAIRAESGDLVIRNCSIVDNIARFTTGTGLYNLGHKTEIRDSIIWGNGLAGGISTGDVSTQIWISTQLQSLVTHSCIMDWQPLDPPFPPPPYSEVEIIATDPLFVPGPDGCHYLSHVLAGQPQTSPCLDAGTASAEDIGLDDRTTRTDEFRDTLTVDLGYHYAIWGRPFLRGDADRNGDVSLSDVAAFQNCFSGSAETPVSPCCRVFDWTGERAVTTDDWPALAVALTGP